MVRMFEVSDDKIEEFKKFYGALGLKVIKKDKNKFEIDRKPNQQAFITAPCVHSLSSVLTYHQAAQNDFEVNCGQNLLNESVYTNTFDKRIKGAGSSASLLTQLILPRKLSPYEILLSFMRPIKLTDPIGNDIYVKTQRTWDENCESQELKCCEKLSLNEAQGEPKHFKGFKIGILTSGGDSPGMNTCIGAFLKICTKLSIPVVLFKNGFSGLVKDLVYDFEHDPFFYNFNDGGTFIGTARCNEFKERSGRKKAVETILKHKISGLVVLGGDGSMRGCSVLSEEFDDLVQEMTAENIQNGSKNCQTKNELKIVHIPFSIDNDIPSAYTIGTDTALEIIQSSAINLKSTFSAHNRLFILEVMGRDSGYLSVVSGVSFADFVLFDTTANRNNTETNESEEIVNNQDEGHFIRNAFEELSHCCETDWITPLLLKLPVKNKKCQAVVLSESAKLCTEHHLIRIELLVKMGLIEEKVLDEMKKTRIFAQKISERCSKQPCQLIRIPPTHLRTLLNPICSTRVLTLGHLQRGSKPVAYDRVVAVISAVRAVFEIIAAVGCEKAKLDDKSDGSNKENRENRIKNSQRQTESGKEQSVLCQYKKIGAPIDSSPISIILNHNDLIKEDLNILLHKIDQKIDENGVKNLIEKIVRCSINREKKCSLLLLESKKPCLNDKNLNEKDINEPRETLKADISRNKTFFSRSLDTYESFNDDITPKTVLFIVHSTPLPGINKIINTINSFLQTNSQNINCFVSLCGFNGLLNENNGKSRVVPIREYDEEKDCAIGYSSDLDRFDKEKRRTINEEIQKFDSVIIIGADSSLEDIEGIFDKQNFNFQSQNVPKADYTIKNEPENPSNMILFLPLSSFLHSLVGSYSTVTHTVNLIDSLRNTFYDKNEILMSENLRDIVGLAVGMRNCSNDSKNHHQLSEKENQKEKNLSKSKENSKFMSNVEVNEGCLTTHSCSSTDSRTLHVDLRPLQSPNTLRAWDRALSVLYGTFTGEILLQHFTGTKIAETTKLKVLVIEMKARLLSPSEFKEWKKREIEKMKFYSAISELMSDI